MKMVRERSEGSGIGVSNWKGSTVTNQNVIGPRVNVRVSFGDRSLHDVRYRYQEAKQRWKGLKVWHSWFGRDCFGLVPFGCLDFQGCSSRSCHDSRMTLLITQFAFDKV